LVHELDHRSGDLVDLRVRVRARIALVRAQPLDRPELDPVGERDQPGAQVGGDRFGHGAKGLGPGK
jgi:hypothetical protein